MNAIALLPNTQQLAAARTRPKKAKEVSEVMELQRLIFERAHKPDIADRSLAILSVAYEKLSERRRILRGKPLPGQLRPDLIAEVKRKQKVSRQPLSIIDDAPPATSPTTPPGAKG